MNLAARIISDFNLRAQAEDHERVHWQGIRWSSLLVARAEKLQVRRQPEARRDGVQRRFATACEGEARVVFAALGTACTNF